jgi:hypothetical protein
VTGRGKAVGSRFRRLAWLIAVLLPPGASATAHAAPEPAAELQQTPAEVRAFVGFGTGIGAEAWILPRLRAVVDAEWLPRWGPLGAVAGIVPIWSSPADHRSLHRVFLGVRAGYQLEYAAGDVLAGSRFAQVPDVGLVFHAESTSGHTLQLDAGGEAVYRQAPLNVCCDHAVLPTTSYGVRVALRGDLALNPRWALFAEVGLRTAEHVVELKPLPTFAVGIRARI